MMVRQQGRRAPCHSLLHAGAQDLGPQPAADILEPEQAPAAAASALPEERHAPPMAFVGGHIQELQLELQHGPLVDAAEQVGACRKPQTCHAQDGTLQAS